MNMGMTSRSVGVAVVLGWGALGCGAFDTGGLACTEMGCEDGLEVAFSLTEPGSYTVEVIADGQLTTCSGTLPLPACDAPSGPTCSSPDVLLGASGCALPEAQHALGGISLLGKHPAMVEVVVERDGTELGRQTFTPSYVRLAPNGEECGPICNRASVDLSL